MITVEELLKNYNPHQVYCKCGTKLKISWASNTIDTPYCEECKGYHPVKFCPNCDVPDEFKKEVE
jgi:hypothetical protein